MSVVTGMLRIVPRRTVAAVSVVAMAVGLTATGAVLFPAWAGGCSTHKTYIEQGFTEDSSPAIRGRAVNSSCSGSHSIRIRVRRNDTFGTDDTISSNEWSIAYYVTSYSRQAQGCRSGSDGYHSDQTINGNERRSGDRDFKNCWA
jgi:hypothetical protein